MKRNNYKNTLVTSELKGNNLSQNLKSNSIKVGELIDKYLKLKVGLRATSIRTISSRVNNWIRPYFDNVYVSDINKEMLFDWFMELQENLSPKTVKLTTNNLKEILEVGVDYYDLENPAANFKFKVKIEDKEKEIWTRDEFNEFISKVDDVHFHLFYETLFNTGMRLGEIRGLQYGDIDLENGTVRINKNLQDIDGESVYQSPKTSKSDRTIYLPTNVLEEYKEYLKLIGPYNKKDRIFNRSQYMYRNYIKVICDMYNLKPITPHGFRHSFATELISLGVPVNYVSAWLGHAKISTTLDFYTHSTEKGNLSILNILNRLHIPKTF